MPLNLWGGRRYYGDENQAEAGAPAVGRFGQALLRAILGGGPDRNVINRPRPVGTDYDHGERNMTGVVVTRPAYNRVVFSGDGYAGILPLDQQPTIRKPDPWTVER